MAASGSDLLHVVVDGVRDPAWNMAVDDAVLHLRQQGVLSGTWVRLYGWSVPAISIGLSQSPHTELDLDAVRRAGVPVVRRSTGGKAVFHVNELTYSLVGADDDPDWGRNLHETYRRVTQILRDALLEIGVATELAPPLARGAPAGVLAAACFGSAYGHELVHAGRKICGSAQRRLRGAFLQHGSLLLGPEQSGLVQFLRVDGDRAVLAARLALDSIDVSTAAGRTVDADTMAAAVRSSLRHAFGDRVREREVLPERVIVEATHRQTRVAIDPAGAPAAP